MAINSQKNFSCNIDPNLADDFSKQADDRGYTKYRAIEGSLRLFIALPAEIQVKLMSDTDENINELLQKSYPLSDDQVEKLWTEMEKIAKKVGVELNKPKRKRG